MCWTEAATEGRNELQTGARRATGSGYVSAGERNAGIEAWSEGVTALGDWLRKEVGLGGGGWRREKEESGGSYGVRGGGAGKGKGDRDRMEEAFLAAQLRERCVWAHAETYTAASWGTGARAQLGARHEHVVPWVFEERRWAPMLVEALIGHEALC